MRRAPIVLASTVAGLAGVLALQPHATPQGTVAEQPLPALTAAASSRNAIVTGPMVDTRYGPVQVQVAKANGRIVEVRALQLPSGDGTTNSLSAYAGPRLEQQALTVQSAHVDGVSGATYTSDGYRQSLQAALDKTATATRANPAAS